MSTFCQSQLMIFNIKCTLANPIEYGYRIIFIIWWWNLSKYIKVNDYGDITHDIDDGDDLKFVFEIKRSLIQRLLHDNKICPYKQAIILFKCYIFLEYDHYWTSESELYIVLYHALFSYIWMIKTSHEKRLIIVNWYFFRFWHDFKLQPTELKLYTCIH